MKIRDTHSGDYIDYLLPPWCRVLPEQLTGLQLVKKSLAFHGTRRFITALTSVRQLSLSWANPIQSIYPHPTSWRSVLILSTHLRLGLPSGIFPSGFHTKILYNPLSSPIRATCPAHLILFNFTTRTILGEEYKSFSSSLCNLLHSPVTSSLLGVLSLSEDINIYEFCCLYGSFAYIFAYSFCSTFLSLYIRFDVLYGSVSFCKLCNFLFFGYVFLLLSYILIVTLCIIIVLMLCIVIVIFMYHYYICCILGIPFQYVVRVYALFLCKCVLHYIYYNQHYVHDWSG